MQSKIFFICDYLSTNPFTDKRETVVSVIPFQDLKISINTDPTGKPQIELSFIKNNGRPVILRSIYLSKDIKGSEIANEFARTIMGYGVEGRGVLDIDTLIDDLFYKNYTLKEYIKLPEKDLTWK